jgi:hypothetical protein
MKITKDKVRKLDKYVSKEYLKGEVVWDSRKQGTYVKARNGVLIANRERKDV